MQCYKCGVRGHAKTDCPETTECCLMCRRLGHTQEDCPDYPDLPKWEKPEKIVTPEQKLKDDEIVKYYTDLVAKEATERAAKAEAEKAAIKETKQKGKESEQNNTQRLNNQQPAEEPPLAKKKRELEELVNLIMPPPRIQTLENLAAAARPGQLPKSINDVYKVDPSAENRTAKTNASNHTSDSNKQQI